MQEIIVYIIIVGALFVVFRHLWRQTGKKRRDNCGSCDGCRFKDGCS